MIGSLLYLTATRPDIIFSVFKYARFQSTPKKSDLTIVKRIIYYLVKTISFGLWYIRSFALSLRRFLDANYVGNKVDRKSTSGFCQFLRNSLVSWNTKK